MNEYTCEELQKEVKLLQHTFEIVRIVDPVICRILTFQEINGRLCLVPDGICYDVWNIPYQCINCTSARALKENATQSKCEVTDNCLFQITSRPLLADGRKVVLEVVQPVAYHEKAARIDEQKLICTVRELNHKLLLDAETDAYTKKYLSEHLPNIFEEAKEHDNYNAVLVRILHIPEISEEYGPTAVSGVICRLYDMLKNLFTTETVEPLLIRYSEDTFFVTENGLSFEDFSSKIASLVEEMSKQHILYQNKLLPFEITAGCAGITKEELFTKEALFSALEERIQKTGGN